MNYYSIDKIKELSKENGILLFDRDCILCSGFVQWLIPKDEKGNFKFMALQSVEKNIFQVDNDYQTVVLFQDGKIFTKSDVTFQILKNLKVPWSLFYPLVFIPKFIRDSIYSLIAKNRYKWFGREENCLIMTDEIRERVIL